MLFLGFKLTGVQLGPLSFSCENDHSSPHDAKIGAKNIISIDKNTLQEDIFNLNKDLSKIGKEKWKPDVDSYVSKYMGLKVSSTGYMHDLYTQKNSISVAIAKSNSQFPTNVVICNFDYSWEKSLLILKKNQGVNFSGTIANYSLGEIILKNCSLY